MDNSILVSVIIPVYNVEKYLKKCVDSVLNQTYPHLQIILVDDGSTDNSRDQLERYSSHPQCTIISQVNQGASAARNTGLDQARGEYISFVDADDWIEPDTIECLVRRMEQTAADFCCFRIDFFNEEKQTERTVGRDFAYDILADKDLILKDAFLGSNIKTSICSKIFRRRFIEENRIRFSVGVINEDCLFSITCALYATKVAFLNKVLYHATERPASVSRSIRPESITSYFYIFPEIKTLLEKNGLWSTHAPYYDAGYTKAMLFTLVQAAFRTDQIQKFLALYRELDGDMYADLHTGSSIKLASTRFYYLYRLSLYPPLFYTAMRMLKAGGMKMY